jgi:hypothetical protein
MEFIFLVLFVLAYVLHMASFGLILLGLLVVVAVISARGHTSLPSHSSSCSNEAHETRDEGETIRQKKTKMDGASIIRQYAELHVQAEPGMLN